LIAAETLNHTRPLVILDNNAVLDWLLFQHPDGLAIGSAIGNNCMHWLGTADMRAELEHVLATGRLDRWAPDVERILSHWLRLCREVPSPPSAPIALRLRCSDPDDQMFIDLAIACRARWLVTRDRAVLKLARRMRALGVEVLTPADWVAAQSSG
jgi:predicted nucleic acid-binding protein